MKVIDTIAIRKGMKVKDLPEHFKVAFEYIEGAIPSVSFKGGKFHKIINVKTHPLSWPVKVEIPLEEGDAIVMCDDFGVYGRLCGATFGAKA